ncbi:PH-like domain-containing protein [Brachybacterium subflavum]|uniref:PH-like domain-containing protein n=1 Tax=Brachybacterium subflavum TaxID=2585206 RepID=UPI0012662E18|nr:ABC transporter permease [Brachybacterium subflavum]
MDLTRYLPPVLALVVVLALCVLLAWWGWRRRAARQGDLPELPQPVAGGKALSWRSEPGSATGVYVATTLAGRPLERVTARGLGPRSRASVSDADDGGRPVLDVERQGAASFLIPWADVRSVHTAPGMVGKWVGGDGLLVVRWQLGEVLLDTGFRLDGRADQDRFLALASERLPADPSDPSPSGPSPSDPALPSTDPQPRKELP